MNNKNNLIKILIVVAVVIGFTIVSSGLFKDNKNTTYKQETATKSATSESTKDTLDKKETNSNIEEAQLHFINTGNSDSILIIQGSKAALIDAGDNDDEKRVVNYIKNCGISELEYVFATHPHSDHIGGLDAVVNSIKVKNIFVSNGDANTKTYYDFVNAMANKGLHPSVPLLNSEFKLGSAYFKVLSVANADNLNNDSIVLEFINGKDKALLMGDAEKEIEANLNPGDVDLIKVGHHGSHSSSSKAFLERVTPEYAVITCGKGNMYGHPHRETMETLKNMNIEVHRSDECGNIVFKSSGNGFSVNCKKGSFTPGSSEKSKNTNTNRNYTKKINNTPIPDPQPQPIVESEITNNSEVVYWTPKGKSYHSSKDCPTLSRSKTILSGSQAESGKSDPCDRCN